MVRNLSSVELSRIFSNILSNAVKYSDGDLNVTLTDNGIIQFSNTAFNLNDVQVERLLTAFIRLKMRESQRDLDYQYQRYWLNK